MDAKLKVKFWDAINAYAKACGGDTSNSTVGGPRMTAVVEVERVVGEVERAAVSRTLGEALNSGSGVYKP